MAAGGADPAGRGGASTGTVRVWHPWLQMAFVAPADGSDEVSVPTSALVGVRRLAVGSAVAFEEGAPEAGRPRRVSSRCWLLSEPATFHDGAPGGASADAAGARQSPPLAGLPVAVAVPPPPVAVAAAPARPPASEMLTGTVKAWIEHRGMGFIGPASGGEDLFVHRSYLRDAEWLTPGQQVAYQEGVDPVKGRRVALVVYAAAPPEAPSAPDASLVGPVPPPPAVPYGAVPPAPPPAGAAGGGGVVQSGVVKLWIAEKAYGFIVPHGGGPDVMVHKKDVAEGLALVQGTAVRFTAAVDPQKGRLKATWCGALDAAYEGHGLASAAVAPANGAAGGPVAPAPRVIPPTNPNAQPASSDTLLVAGLPVEVNDGLLAQIFSQYGTVSSCSVLPLRPGATDTSAVVRMADVESARWLVANLNGNIPSGLVTPVTVQLASPQVTSYGRAPSHDVGMFRSAPYAVPAAPPPAPVAAGMLTGVVKTWIEHKGIGFIAPGHDPAGGDIFVHRNFLTNAERLEVGQVVLYEEGFDAARGKKLAKPCIACTAVPAGSADAAALHAAAPGQAPVLAVAGQAAVVAQPPGVPMVAVAGQAAVAQPAALALPSAGGGLASQPVAALAAEAAGWDDHLLAERVAHALGSVLGAAGPQDGAVLHGAVAAAAAAASPPPPPPPLADAGAHAAAPHAAHAAHAAQAPPAVATALPAAGASEAAAAAAAAAAAVEAAAQAAQTLPAAAAAEAAAAALPAEAGQAAPAGEALE